MHSVHANLDRDTRAGKARKIVRLLGDRVTFEGATVLEIGTGSGVIAQALKGTVGPRGDVWAVDVVDQRLEREGVQFRAVAGTSLPFDDAMFDLVVSNHVIEHVGDRAHQRDHLAEIARVLRPGGWLYLATPNRFAPVEPHFRLPLLGWLPAAYRSSYVRAARRGEIYDCWPLTHAEVGELLVASTLVATEVTREAIGVMAAEERPSASFRAIATAAVMLYPVIRPILPTFIFLARRAA